MSTSSHAGQGVFEAVYEQRPVGLAGEGVVEGSVSQLLLQDLPLGNVAGVDHHTLHRKFVGQVVTYHSVQPGPRAIFVAKPELHALGTLRRLRAFGEGV